MTQIKFLTFLNKQNDDSSELYPSIYASIQFIYLKNYKVIKY